MIILELSHRASVSMEVAPRKVSETAKRNQVVMYIDWSDGVNYSYDLLGSESRIRLTLEQLGQDYNVAIKKA